TQGDITAAGHEAHAFQNRFWLDVLVEGEEDERFQRLWSIYGIAFLQLRRRRAEGPAHRFLQLSPVGGNRSGRDFGNVFGGHGEAIASLALIFKGQRLGSNPTPDAGKLRGQLYRHLL